MSAIFLPPPTKLRQGNVFTPVSQSFCSQGGGVRATQAPSATHAPSPRDMRSMIRQYASYWNAFLFLKKLFTIFGGHKFFLWGYWYPCFGLLVMSPLGFKARVGSLIRAWQRHTPYTFPEMYLWCDTCWPLGSQYGWKVNIVIGVRMIMFILVC